MRKYRKDGVTVNERQKKFAEYYAQSGNTVQSAIKAGYSQNYANGRAYELLENVGISTYIRELTEKAQDERIMTARERRAVLSDIAREGNNQDRIRAIDTLNKMTGEYTTKIEGSISADVNNPFKDLTTEELRKLAD
jgi:phage terminase small subunit